MNFRKFCLFFLLFLPAINLYSQVYTHIKPVSPIKRVNDSSVLFSKPDSDRDDLPFIDYHPAIIWTNPSDTLCTYGYIRKNFTDQLFSVWNPPERYYPASRVYALSLDGNYYRTIMVSPKNYVFAQQIIKGEMSFYLYRIIPQTNGWVELVSADTKNPGYSNLMIVEVKGMRGAWKNFGYYISLCSDSSRMIPVMENQISTFASIYLSGTPEAYAKAMKFGNQNVIKARKYAVLGIMATALAGTVFIGNNSKYLFLAGFPLAAVVALINKPHHLHWEDLAGIVTLHNKELASRAVQ